MKDECRSRKPDAERTDLLTHFRERQAVSCNMILVIPAVRHRLFSLHGKCHHFWSLLAMLPGMLVSKGFFLL